eukprot:gene19412-22067_t
MDYNSRLLPIVDKGLCGDPEICEKERTFKKKISNLVDMICESKRIVAFTGAGISTSCGIPDFRGPNGVWTKELRGEKSTSTENWFDQAIPSYTHYALACLQHLGILSYTISQNVDSLHIRSGIPETALSELHGNICKEKCTQCGHEYVRDFDVGGMGLKPTGRLCSIESCGGPLHDKAYDWDTNLPEEVFDRAEQELQRADLVLVLGTSLRVIPAGNLPKLVQKARKERNSTVGKMAIVNLQCTHLDKRADVRIFHYCDDVMRALCQQLGIIVSEKADKNSGRVDASWYKIVPGSKLEALLDKTSSRIGIVAARTITTPTAEPESPMKTKSKKRPNEEKVEESVPSKKLVRGEVTKTNSEKSEKKSNMQPEALNKQDNRGTKNSKSVMSNPISDASSTSIWEVLERYNKQAERKSSATGRKS